MIDTIVTMVATKKERSIDFKICGSSNVNLHHSSDQLSGSLSGYCHLPENARRSKFSNGPKKKSINMDKNANSIIFLGLTVLKYHNFSHLLDSGNVPTFRFFSHIIIREIMMLSYTILLTTLLQRGITLSIPHFMGTFPYLYCYKIRSNSSLIES